MSSPTITINGGSREYAISRHDCSYVAFQFHFIGHVNIEASLSHVNNHTAVQHEEFAVISSMEVTSGCVKDTVFRCCGLLESFIDDLIEGEVCPPIDSSLDNPLHRPEFIVAIDSASSAIWLGSILRGRASLSS
jgi:hypothetical protein